ncbi:transcriptional regulator of PTS gene [Candidatus Pantoea symbiotica]|uniref:Transcriptional regulator of PTS protein n=1 Tax=Candidatus Pantoea symbiotica TaxID=1884370 RepID=A0A1I3TVW3_9GAMM|nr:MULTISPECIES: ROK family protein [Pantoea]KAJ9433068.1 ROK family protein [Pantoea sp. YR343]MRT25376.1 ROK family protein [Enterobacteriaceae bacterium RIT697]SFJ74623.1 transcriptional regulator of PTS gene [Pantoea symbiotica]SFU46415.1 transcriptional regulator of PTS gene [Pantoea sp. YR525]
MNLYSQPGHIDQIKQTNAGVVYRLIDLYGPISRIELSKRAQLAPASITKIVREMLDAHLVQETEFQEPGSRGRPAIGLILDTLAWHYLAVRIQPGYITLTLRDLSSRALQEDRLPLHASAEKPLLQTLLDLVNDFFIRHQSKLERLTAIAITLPGLINAASGVVHRMPGYDVQDMPLGETLAQRTGLPVFVQHDISAWTLAEALFGASSGAQHVIQIVIDETVGAGVISGGQLLHKNGRTLVEIGHTQIDPYGQQCYCGNNGCLETVASIESLLTLTAQRLPSQPDSLLHQAPLTIESLCAAAQQGDRLARDVIAGVGHHIGRMLAMMVNIFNPQQILIGSPLNQAADVLFPAVSSTIRQQALPAYSSEIQLTPTAFSDPGTFGGAALIKDALYSGHLLVKLLQG